MRERESDRGKENFAPPCGQEPSNVSGWSASGHLLTIAPSIHNIVQLTRDILAVVIQLVGKCAADVEVQLVVGGVQPGVAGLICRAP